MTEITKSPVYAYDSVSMNHNIIVTAYNKNLNVLTIRQVTDDSLVRDTIEEIITAHPAAKSFAISPGCLVEA